MPELPAPVPGLTWRPAAIDDAEALDRLDAACHEVDLRYRMVASEYREQLTRPGNDPRVDGIVAVDDTGDIVVFGLVFMTGGDRSKHRAFPWGHVHPAFRRRGLGTALQAWLEERAAERLTVFDDGLPRVIRLSAYDHQVDRLELFERFGYQPTRYFIEMVRAVSDPCPPRPKAAGIEIRELSEAARAAAREVHNRAFTDHWGSEPATEAAWEHRFDEFFLPEASFVAYDGDEPVAYLISGMYPHDFEPRGRTEAWIEGLGTVRSHRGRGIASLLILETLARLRDLDVGYALIGVDAENPTNAVALYERLGFREERRSVTYAKWLG